MVKLLLHCLAVLLLLNPFSAQAAHGIALFGELKYKPGFTHFDYVNPNAPKGGTVKYSSSGTFDSVNPFILKGVAAPGITPYVFQTLMTPSYDEPQSYYGLIARAVTVAPDHSYADFTLNKKARWQDGKPVTADDVIWTFHALKENGHPLYRVMYAPISEAEEIRPGVVRFHFTDLEHRELPLIAAAMPVLPKHYYATVPFDKTSLKAPIGSGPYTITAINPGRSITFTRVKNWWGEKLPVEVGMNNFDTITIDIYRDDVVALEGIKSGQFDYYEEYIARNWSTAYNIPAVKDGRIIKQKIQHKIPRGMQAFMFNTRAAKFADARVREAIGLTLDFQWMNQTLFYGAYERNYSYFQNNDPFMATGLPMGDELKLLEPYRDQLPPDLFEKPFAVPTTDGTGYARDNLIKAQHLLDDAGWVMKDGKRTNAKTGEVLTIEFLMTQRTFERVVGIMRRNLAKLGIDSSFRYVDASQYQRRLDKRSFDIVSIWWNQGLMFPGSEQFTFWHSSEADKVGSQNVGGIKNPVVDDLVTRIMRAQTLEQLQPAAKALDRVLLWNHYVIPHWYMSAWRIIYWNKFGRPKITPDYNLCLECWWLEPHKNVPLSKTTSHSARTHRVTEGEPRSEGVSEAKGGGTPPSAAPAATQQDTRSEGVPQP